MDGLTMRGKLSSGNVIALIALLLALTGGAVYAAGKIGPKQISKNAVRSRHIGPDQAKGIDILESSLDTVPRAQSADTALRADSAASADSARRADTATSADSAQSAQSAQTAQSAESAQTANSADSVGGVSVEPVRVAIPDPTFEETNLILSVAGDSVGVGCSGGGSIPVHILRGASGPPLFFAVHRQGLAEQIGAPPVPAGITFGGPAGTYSITIREASGRVTQLDMTGFYQANAFGGPEDCFAQGTIKRFG